MRNLLTLLLLVFATLVWSQEETYTISGRVNAASPKGRIYIYLCDESNFLVPNTGVDTVEFWVNYDKTHVEYEFKDIPAGQYAIKAYQDKNGNHKFDKWLFGPIEPWGYSYSKTMKFPPEFKDVSFDLYYDQRINIMLGN